MESWAVGFAKNFKERDNPKPIGPCIGKVESLSPVCISIQSGQHMLRANQIYVCNQLLERKSSYNDFTSKGSGQFPCNEGKIANGNYDCSGSGNIHLNAVWKVWDFVMVVPDESGQHFFIVDILKGVS